MIRALGFGAILLAALAINAGAQDRNWASEFEALKSTGKQADVDKFLAQWKEAAPSDPEVYITAANYLFETAGQVSIDAGTPSPDAIATLQKDGETVGGISATTNANRMEKAVAELETARGKFPSRLDIWLGEAYLLEQAGEFDREEKLLRELCQKDAKGDLWTKKGGKPDGDSAKLIPATLHSRTMFYARQESKEGDERAKKIAELAIKYYPKHPYAYNTLATIYSYDENWAKAREYLEKALAVAPRDTLVMVNLGEVLAKTGDTAASRKMMEQAIAASPDSENAEYAREFLKELGKPKK